jgi:hypothetical protein
MACAIRSRRAPIDLRVQAQLGQDGVGVLAQRGHGAQRGSPASQARRQQRGHRAGRRVDRRQRPRACQLRMRPQAGHVVDLGVGDLRVFQALAPPARRSGAAKARRRSAHAAFAVRGALRVAGKRSSCASAGWQQHLGAEGLPLAFVLQAQHHRLAVAGLGNGP